MPRAHTADWCRCRRKPRPSRRLRPRTTGAESSRPLPGVCAAFLGARCGSPRSAPLAAQLALGRPQHRAAALPGAAAAGKDLIDVRRIGAIAPDLIVVDDFLARLNGGEGPDENAPIPGQRLAVRIAGMVDEARIIAIGAAVDHHAAVDDEQECVIVADVFMLVAQIGLPVRHPVAQVLDDSRALADSAHGEHAAAMNARAAHTHHCRSRLDRGHSGVAPRSALLRPLGAAWFPSAWTHTATRARIAGWN